MTTVAPLTDDVCVIIDYTTENVSVIKDVRDKHVEPT